MPAARSPGPMCSVVPARRSASFGASSTASRYPGPPTSICASAAFSPIFTTCHLPGAAFSDDKALKPGGSVPTRTLSNVIIVGASARRETVSTMPNTIRQAVRERISTRRIHTLCRTVPEETVNGVLIGPSGCKVYCQEDAHPGAYLRRTGSAVLDDRCGAGGRGTTRNGRPPSAASTCRVRGAADERLDSGAGDG